MRTDIPARLLFSLALILMLGAATAPAADDDREYESTYPEKGINTNYMAGVGFCPGGTDPDDRPWFQPTSDSFPYMRTDYCAPTPEEIEAYIDTCENWGAQRYKVRLINTLTELTVDGTDPRVQIVPNFIILDDEASLTGGYSTSTLYFPPHFKIMPDHRYPLLFMGSGWGSALNLRIRDRETFIADSVKMSQAVLDPRKRGVIGIATNCGGDGSVGATRWYLRDVALLFDLLHREYGGDRNKVVARGSSRGGSIALLVAENPYEGDPDFPPYRVLGVFPRGFPVRAGVKSQRPLSLASTYGSFYGTELGPNADRYSFVPPPQSNPAYVLQAPMGTIDVIEANERSADGRWLWKLADTFVALQFGTHDSWMGRQGFLHIDRKLSLLGIPHVSYVILGPGHNTPAHLGDYSQIPIEFMVALFSDPDFDPREFRPGNAGFGLFEKARNYYHRADGRVDTLNDWSSLRHLGRQTTLPFMATIPYRLGRKVRDTEPWHEPGGIELSGTIGRRWQVFIRDDTGTVVADYSGAFGVGPALQSADAETTMVQWGHEGLPNNDTTAYYAYQFFYEDKTGRMVDVSNFTNFMVETSSGSGEYRRMEAKTEILETQPYASQYLVSSKMMSFGIDWCETMFSFQQVSH